MATTFDRPAHARAGLLHLHAVAVFALIAMAGPAPANAQLRVMSYNLLNYPGSTSAVREPAYRAIIAAADPHVIAAQEVIGLSAAEQFRVNVLDAVNPGVWARATFINGPDTDNALYYRTDRVVFLSGDADGFAVIPTALRNIDRWKLRLLGYTSSDAVFYVYSCHLASSGGASAREAEAAILRSNANALAAGSKFIVAGDMNMSGTSEGAYQQLTSSQADNDGRCTDPLNPSLASQNWNSNFSFRFIHTQSPRSGLLTPNDGGATGGMDDRFDLAIVSDTLYFANPNGQGLAYQLNSTVAFGNDGNHYNTDLNAAPTNTAVGQELADHVQRASDHLPVIIGLRVPAIINSANQVFFNRVIVGGSKSVNYTVSNDALTEVVDGADVLNYQLTAPSTPFDGPAGSFSDAPLGGQQSHQLTFEPLTFGQYQDTFSVTSNDLDSPVKNVTVNGRGVRHANGSLDSGSSVTSDTLDFGVHPVGQFTAQLFEVYNVGADQDVFQSGLDLYGHSIVGDVQNRFSVTSGLPAVIGDSPSVIEVSFDDTGLTPGSNYSATLKLQIRDEQLPGATNYSDLEILMTAGVPVLKGDMNLSGMVDSPDVPQFVDVVLGVDTSPLAVFLADMDDSGTVDGDDIQMFIEALF